MAQEGSAPAITEVGHATEQLSLFTTMIEPVIKGHVLLLKRLPGEISITSDTQMAPPLRQKAKKN